MSNYHVLKKDNIKHDSSNPISFVEYMIVQKQEQSKAFIMFKIGNNTKSKIKRVELSIEYFNIEDEKIGSNVFQIDDIIIEPLDNTVPSVKVKCIDGCDSIKVDIVSVETDTHFWEENNWIEKQPRVKLFDQEKLYEVKKMRIKNQGYPFFISLISLAVFSIILLVVFSLINT